MFDKIDSTWNPLCGVCPHDCCYCWAKALIKRHNMKKYQGEYRIKAKELNRKFKPDSMVFVCDMLDLFADDVPAQLIIKILNVIEQNPQTTFLLLTKNPLRYVEYQRNYVIPSNCICGATIESDLCYTGISKTPSQKERIVAMICLNHPRKMISIEPIMVFSEQFAKLLSKINLEFVYIGKDNYNNKIPTPVDERIEELIVELEKFTEVRRK